MSKHSQKHEDILARQRAALEAAVADVGGYTAMGQCFGLSYQAIQKWRATQVPLEYVADIERLTDGRITRRQLREDWDATLYGRRARRAA